MIFFVEWEILEQIVQLSINLFSPNIVRLLCRLWVFFIHQANCSNDLTTNRKGPFTFQAALTPHFGSNTGQVLVQEFDEWRFIKFTYLWFNFVVYYLSFCHTLILIRTRLVLALRGDDFNSIVKYLEWDWFNSDELLNDFENHEFDLWTC